jgi:hypothetical protein
VIDFAPVDRDRGGMRKPYMPPPAYSESTRMNRRRVFDPNGDNDGARAPDDSYDDKRSGSQSIVIQRRGENDQQSTQRSYSGHKKITSERD